MVDFSIMTVNYNTPMYVYTLLKSLQKTNPWYSGELVVLDNSTIKEFPECRACGLHIKYVPDSIYSYIDALPPSSYPAAGRYNSARHSVTIDYGIQQCKTDYLLLLDSDILITKNFEDILSSFVKSGAGLLGYKRTTYKHHCIAPWCCFINVKLMREHNLSFHDYNRIIYVNGQLSYDTGASLYEDFTKLNVNCIETKDNTFYIHFKGGSVNQTGGINFLINHRSFWDD